MIQERRNLPVLKKDNILDYYFINRLYGELKILEEEKVIDSETSGKIRQFYENKKTEAAEVYKKTELEAARKRREKLPFVLSLISSILIFIGIVSLIAYNWNAIGRLPKTIAALFIAFVPPFLYLILNSLFQRKQTHFPLWLKDFFAILWTLLFGSAYAFITQIYRIPANDTAFLAVWMFSSIFIAFAMKSSAVYYFSLFFTSLYSIYGQCAANETAVFFYPAVILLYLFARKKTLEKNVLFGCAVVLLGFVLEKNIPGLWILCYSGVAAFLFIISSKVSEAYKKIWKAFSWIFITGFVCLLCFTKFWTGIGWNNFRNADCYNEFVSIFDYVVTAALYFVPVVYFVSSIIKKSKSGSAAKTNYVVLAFLLLIGICFASASVNQGVYVFVPRVLLYFVFAVFVLSMIFAKNFYPILGCIPVLIIFCITQIQFQHLQSLNVLMTACVIFSYKKLYQKYSAIPFLLIGFLLLFENYYYGFSDSLFSMKINIDSPFYLLDKMLFIIPVGLILYAFIMHGCCVLFMKLLKKPVNSFDLISKKPPLMEFVFTTLCMGVLLWNSVHIHSGMAQLDFIFILFGIAGLVLRYVLKNIVYYSFVVISVLNFPVIIHQNFSELLVYAYIFLIISALFVYFKTEDKIFEELSTALLTVAAVAMTIPLFYKEIFSGCVQLPSKNQYISLMYFAFIFVFAFVIPVLKLIKARKFHFLTISASALNLIVALIIQRTIGISDSLYTVFETTAIIFMVMFSVSGIFDSYRNFSPLKVNLYTIYFCFILVVKLFQLSNGLIERGIICIAAGFLILIMNKIMTGKAAEQKNQV